MWMQWNWKIVAGTVVILGGVLLIMWTAYQKFTHRTVESNLLLAGLLLAASGAFLVKRGRTDQNTKR